MIWMSENFLQQQVLYRGNWICFSGNTLSYTVSDAYIAGDFGDDLITCE